MIYLDNSATTRVCPEAVAAMTEAMTEDFFNPSALYAPSAKVKVRVDEVRALLLKELAPDYINGLSLLGGEPFEPQNQAALLPFLRRVKAQFPQKTIWCYTGYLFDTELLADSRARCAETDEMLSLIDVLVDGEFVQALYNISLQFRGSSNQRIIDVPKSLASGTVVPYVPMSGRIER